LLQKFALDLQWHGGPQVWHDPEETLVHFNNRSMQFNHDVHIAEISRLLHWRYNVDPVVGIKIRMRVHFYIPLNQPQVQGENPGENPRNVSVGGDAMRVQKALARGRVSIDAIEWKILDIKEIDTEQGKQQGFMGRTVRLRCSVSDYTYSDPKQISSSDCASPPVR